GRRPARADPRAGRRLEGDRVGAKDSDVGVERPSTTACGRRADGDADGHRVAAASTAGAAGGPARARPDRAAHGGRVGDDAGRLDAPAGPAAGHAARPGRDADLRALAEPAVSAFPAQRYATAGRCHGARACLTALSRAKRASLLVAGLAAVVAIWLSVQMPALPLLPHASTPGLRSPVVAELDTSVPHPNGAALARGQVEREPPSVRRTPRSRPAAQAVETHRPAPAHPEARSVTTAKKAARPHPAPTSRRRLVSPAPPQPAPSRRRTPRRRVSGRRSWPSSTRPCRTRTAPHSHAARSSASPRRSGGRRGRGPPRRRSRPTGRRRRTPRHGASRPPRRRRDPTR